MGKRKISMELSEDSIKNAIQELEDYKQELVRKCHLLAEKLAEKGVEIAKIKIASYDAVYTGELLESINCEPGAVIKEGASWIIYTDCPWAKFVEFGTGIVGAHHPHTDTSISGWKYDVNEHGEAGWFYFRDGEWNWTKGMPSRPFMYETNIELMKHITEVAREVFG
nr:MAG TPA: tail component protein [Caudoviricetes sp.]